jgi:hypothetical protein
MNVDSSDEVATPPNIKSGGIAKDAIAGIILPAIEIHWNRRQVHEGETMRRSEKLTRDIKLWPRRDVRFQVPKLAKREAIMSADIGRRHWTTTWAWASAGVQKHPFAMRQAKERVLGLDCISKRGVCARKVQIFSIGSGQSQIRNG